MWDQISDPVWNNFREVNERIRMKFYQFKFNLKNEKNYEHRIHRSR